MKSSPVAESDMASRQVENRSAVETAVALNIGAAIFFSGFFYVLRNWASMRPANDSTYFCFRDMYRVIDFLGIQSHSPVATNAVQRELLTRSEMLGAEVFAMVTWLGVAAAAILILLSLRHTRLYRLLVGLMTRNLLLFAGPACFLGASSHSQESVRPFLSTMVKLARKTNCGEMH